MNTLRLIGKSLSFTWDSQKANPVDLAMAAGGMILNNVLLISGLWMMLFAGKSQHHSLFLYFLAMQTFVPFAWGLVQFFAGGWFVLAEMIESGTFETMLSTPRHPLFLAALARSNPTGLGDIFQGMISLTVLFWIAPWDYAFRTSIVVILSALAMGSLFILSGSLGFFFARGTEGAQLLNQVNLSLSNFPMGRVFGDRGRMLLALTPAAALAVFPLDFIEVFSWRNLLLTLMALSILMSAALLTFHVGVKRFRGNSSIGFKG